MLSLHNLFHHILLVFLPVALAGDYSTPGTPTAAMKPTRPFTAAAFLSPYPSGTPGQISGVSLVAQHGTFWLNPSNIPLTTGCGGGGCLQQNETVLWVGLLGLAWLDSQVQQQVYIDTATGALRYIGEVTTSAGKFTPGAVINGFLHLGQGKTVSVPIPGEPAFANVGPATFQWTGTAASGNPSWFACPRTGGAYQVMKMVGGTENWNNCLSGLQLVALDYEGASPATVVYES